MTIQAVQAQTPKQKITSLLLSMGHKVENMLDQAIVALLHSNTHIVTGLMENAVAIQELEVAVDQAVFAALESGELPSSEIRQATSVINISKELGRLGKLAASLGRRVSQVGEHNDHEDFSLLQPLAIAVSHLCRQTLRALTRMDCVLARNAAAGSATVDAYRDYVLRTMRNPASVSNEQNIHLIFASRCLEQIADHASELAENLVVFLNSSSSCESSRSESRQQVAC
jgi:phosphate transport system protein